MLPLAVLMKSRGYRVVGSDRGYDQGKTPAKFQALKDFGIELFPQDGSGVLADISRLVVSSAVEPTIPDVQAALARGIEIIKRGALLAEQFNAALTGIAIAGTSGKSTVTGMLATILLELGVNPSMVNGGEVRNIASRFPGVHVGREDVFLAEMDESDGSIAAYNPAIAVLNNIALDHKSMEELEGLFGDYLARAQNEVVVNGDHPRVMGLVRSVKPQARRIITYGLGHENDMRALDVLAHLDGISFDLACAGKIYPVHLKVPGVHNVMNALAALGVAEALNLDLAQASKALEVFAGIHRRLELIGTKNGITVLDDFAHNPDKIAASLATLKAFDGRLIVMFQPHGFGPMKLMRSELVQSFCEYLTAQDILLMPEAYYAGGTVDRSVTARDLIADIQAQGFDARWFAAREDIIDVFKREAKAGDRIVIMGARDDTLHQFAKSLLSLF